MLATKSKLKEIVKTWAMPPGILTLFAKVSLRMKQRNTDQFFEQDKNILNRHQGERCFILGAGSSIAQQDLKKLVGECVISVSNTFVHPDFSRIKPRYHVLPPLLKSHGRFQSEENFVGWLRAMEVATGDADMFMHIGDRWMIERNGLFKDRIIHWVEYVGSWDENFDAPINLRCLPPIWSVSELALTVAVYLGFDKIYLIGIDHDWFNGVLVYFYDHTKEHALRPDESDLSFADSEFQMRRHANIFKKYKYLYSMKRNIYNANANPSHYLDVFPKVNFDSLF